MCAAALLCTISIVAADGDAVVAPENPVIAAARDGKCGDELASAIAAATTLEDQDAKFGATALSLAALGGHVDCVNALLEAGADMEARDKYELTALSAAAVAGHESVLKALLARGAADKDAALRHATAYGRHEAVMALLNSGANPNAADASGQSAVDIAKEGKHKEIVTFLQNAVKDKPWQAAAVGKKAKKDDEL